jgi:hypothetical protein
MRPIKFRAKNSRTGQWVYWDLMLSPNEWADKGLSELDLETVGEFTGLKDKNGKEIYEGDIVLRVQNGQKSEVYYVEDIGYLQPFGCHDDSWTGSESEIIGNIYENNNLLKEKTSDI